MENNIPTLYILELDSLWLKVLKFQLFYALLSKKKQSCIRVAMVHMTQAK